MSMFSVPEEMIKDVARIAKLSDEFAEALPREMASAINLMAHPMAGAAAASALGIGFASQAFGFWLGAVAGAAEASQRMFEPLFDDAEDIEAISARQKTPETCSRSAAKTLIADALMVADDAADVALKAAESIVDDLRDTADAVAEIAEHSIGVVLTQEEAAVLMPEDFRQPRPLEMPARPDDLKRIAGIGPKLEQVLNGLGIWTYAQISDWKREEVAWIDDYLAFKGRINRDRWIEQAASLARQGALH